MDVTDRMLKADMKEPLMVEWVLGRIEEKLSLDEQAVYEIETALFHEGTIPYMIDHFDADLLARLFRVVSSRRFRPHIQMILDRWPMWTDDLACWSAPVMAQYSPNAAAAAFKSWCGKGDIVFGDFSKWHGIMKGISLLPAETARDLSVDFVRVYVDSQIDLSITHLYSIYILALAWTYDHPELSSVFKAYILPLPTSSANTYRERMTRLMSVFGFSAMEFNRFCDAIEQNVPLWNDDRTHFYRCDIPFEVFDLAVDRIQKRSFDFMRDFMNQHGHVITEERVRFFFQDHILDDRLVSLLHRKKQRPYIYALVLSCMMASLRRETLNLSGMSIKEVVRLIASPVETIPDMHAVTSYLKTTERHETIRCLQEALAVSSDHLGGSHVVHAMAALGYEEFLGSLSQIVSNRSATETVYRLAESAMAGYGEKAIDYFTDHFEHFSAIGRLAALTVSHYIGGPRAVRFVETHFDAYWKSDRESLLRVCEALGCVRFRDRIRHRTGMNQMPVDRAYLVLSLLDGDRGPEIETLLQQYTRKRNEQRQIDSAVQRGCLLDAITPYIDAELRCTRCGDVNVYPLHRIFVTDANYEKPYIAEEIRCLNCNLKSEFDFTPKGIMTVTHAMSRIMMLHSLEEKKEALERSPIKIISSNWQGKSMAIQEALRKSEKAAAEDPENPEPDIVLGNIYANTHQFTKADACYRNAIQKDPSYLQPYFALAQMANYRGNPHEALDVLETARAFALSPKFIKGSEPKASDAIASFCALHQSLIKTTQRKYPILQPADFHVHMKVGRNDACPCGSGKKYKKCCLMKNA